MAINMNKFTNLEKYIYAHRGFHDKPTVPENSMAAFCRAKERSYAAELDIHLMKDGNLAVIHDASLKRTAGTDVLIEDLTAADLEKYDLEASKEHIPLLQDVLKLEIPLIVELKVERGNYNELAEAAWNALKDYPAPWCMESFDPRALLWFQKHQPQVCRGQLSQDFKKNSEVAVPWYQKIVLNHMWFNILTKPDFIAYKFEDRESPYLQKYRKRGVREFNWTIRDQESFDAVKALGNIPIFEQFTPN